VRPPADLCGEHEGRGAVGGRQEQAARLYRSQAVSWVFGILTFGFTFVGVFFWLQARDIVDTIEIYPSSQ